jgi:hypothetical protein
MAAHVRPPSGCAQTRSSLCTARRSDQIIGLILAGLSAINAMFTFAAYPLWSATILVVDVLVIYGLAVHGDDYA